MCFGFISIRSSIQSVSRRCPAINLLAPLCGLSLRGTRSDGYRSTASIAGFTVMWNEALSRASFGPIALVNLSTVTLKSLACICCNSIVTSTMSKNQLSESCLPCARAELPPSIRSRLTIERLLHTAHPSPRLLLMTSQSRQKTALEREGECLRPNGSLLPGQHIHHPLLLKCGQLKSTTDYNDYSQSVSCQKPCVPLNIAVRCSINLLSMRGLRDVFRHREDSPRSLYRAGHPRSRRACR